VTPSPKGKAFGVWRIAKQQFVELFIRQSHFDFQSSRSDTSICPKGIFHIASAIFHISAGNISLSRQGKFHYKNALLQNCNRAFEL
jgi:hypothetical protein